jgi:hypothetical protein
MFMFRSRTSPIRPRAPGDMRTSTRPPAGGDQPSLAVGGKRGRRQAKRVASFSARIFNNGEKQSEICGALTTLTHSNASSHRIIPPSDGMNDAAHMQRPPRSHFPPSATDSPISVGLRRSTGPGGACAPLPHLQHTHTAAIVSRARGKVQADVGG